MAFIAYGKHYSKYFVWFLPRLCEVDYMNILVMLFNIVESLGGQDDIFMYIVYICTIY